MILNGRAAVCAGRDEMSSEEESFEEKKSGNHKFATPDNFNFKLESGDIPDASMIHEIRKRRQKAREQGDFIAIEEPKEDKKGKRNIHEDEVGDGSDGSEEDRVDMLAITGHKEREERREKFYSVQQQCKFNKPSFMDDPFLNFLIISDSGEDSDLEMNEWENMQIRKGVTGAQLMSAQQESVYSQYMIQPFSNSFSNMVSNDDKNLTTAELLEQAYSHVNYDFSKKSQKSTKKGKDTRTAGPKTPEEIRNLLYEKLRSSKELNNKHYEDIEKIAQQIDSLKIDLSDCEQDAPQAAEKYKFYQEIKCFVSDLVECFDEKVGISFEESLGGAGN